MSKDHLDIDYETSSTIDLKAHGLDQYINDRSSKVLMAAWSINGEEVEQWDALSNPKPPKILVDALRDPNVENWAFNAQFERLATSQILGIDVPYNQWRCIMVLAYMMGFSGDLKTVGRAVGISLDKQKLDSGSKLIRKFCKPQKLSKANPHEWHDSITHPVEWDEFLLYNRMDVVAEMAIKDRLIKFPVPKREWDLYEIDQRINDRGVMINRQHAVNALDIAAERKQEIVTEMKGITGLANPNSPAQLLPWLQERGYPFSDMIKDTVRKVVNEAPDNGVALEAVEVLKMRMNSSKNSVAKYNTMLKAVGEDGAFRYSLQFHGASRTARWAGRRLQTHNLPRTPKIIESEPWLSLANKFVMDGDKDGLTMLMGEPIDGVVGTIRSALVAREGKTFRVADLSSIESVVIGWFTECKWFMQTLDNGLDLYRAFASNWLKIPYEETMPKRSMAKPATLGAGYRLGGGDLIEGKKTGLWGYAENMGVVLTKEESHESVNAFRELCPEIVDSWYALEKAAKKCIGRRMDVRYKSIVFEWRKPFMCILLPTGRRMYYFNPQVTQRTMQGKNGTYVKSQVSYMGKPQNGVGWVRVYTHGGKFIENIVQALAREVLAYGIIRAHRDGFDIPLHVHDEIVTEQDIDDEYHSLDRLIDHMTRPMKWAKGLNLKAAGWEGPFYRKD